MYSFHLWKRRSRDTGLWPRKDSAASCLPYLLRFLCTLCWNALKPAAMVLLKSSAPAFLMSARYLIWYSRQKPRRRKHFHTTAFVKKLPRRFMTRACRMSAARSRPRNPRTIAVTRDAAYASSPERAWAAPAEFISLFCARATLRMPRIAPSLRRRCMLSLFCERQATRPIATDTSALVLPSLSDTTPLFTSPWWNMTMCAS